MFEKTKISEKEAGVGPFLGLLLFLFKSVTVNSYRHGLYKILPGDRCYVIQTTTTDAILIGIGPFVIKFLG